MKSLLGESGKVVMGTQRWLVGWEDALTAASTPIHLPLLIAAGLKA